MYSAHCQICQEFRFLKNLKKGFKKYINNQTTTDNEVRVVEPHITTQNNVERTAAFHWDSTSTNVQVELSMSKLTYVDCRTDAFHHQKAKLTRVHNVEGTYMENVLFGTTINSQSGLGMVYTFQL
ncbi:hypothetical protein C8Q75DRAFT_780217, partial [Abortiporus biennis]